MTRRVEAPARAAYIAGADVRDSWGARVPETESEQATRPPTAEAFEAYRPLLFAIAYRMLGSAMEAEDVVQDAYLRYQATPPDTIRSEKAFLSTVVTRLCLDQIKSARSRRESYVGPWLPEPLLTDALGGAPAPADRVTQAESISMAFLVLLESLTPWSGPSFCSTKSSSTATTKWRRSWGGRSRPAASSTGAPGSTSWSGARDVPRRPPSSSG
jgi:DNA-directed RNA polymerase specialized sigma24 family protein